jgi:hypothetical protein
MVSSLLEVVVTSSATGTDGAAKQMVKLLTKYEIIFIK